MNKVRSSQDIGTWIPTIVQAAYIGVLQNSKTKSVVAKANRAVEKGVSTYYSGSISTTTQFEKMVILVSIYILYLI